MSLLSRNVRFALSPIALVVSLAAAEAGGGLPKKSPFEVRGVASAPAAAASETIEFAGVSSIGKKTDLIFYDKTAKKSHWIAPGETKEGIAVINYDARREEAVVKINGVQKTLALRKAAGPVGGARPATGLPGGFNTYAGPSTPPAVNALPAANPVNAAVSGASSTNPPPQPTAPAPAPGSPAEIQARQETEARMLVSDLLEIGMAQRRAYEEAQRKAAEAGMQTQPAPANPPAPSPQSTAPSP
jgi:hypothetical protein